MRKHLGMVILAVLVVAVFVIYTATFQVDEFRDIVLVKRFGKVRGVYRGHDQAGLHFKWIWPVEKVVRYDARTFTFESPYAQLETKDKQNILVSMYCNWRISDPVQFHKTVETQEVAEKNIRARLQAKSGDVVGQYELESFVNTDPKRMLLQQISQEILALLKQEVDQTYGVEVREVGIKRWGFPKNVSDAVIEAQKKEREKYVQTYKAEGEARATAIRERAKAASDTIIAFAKRKAAEIRSEGDRASAELRKEFEQNPQLSEFLRSLESLKIGLQSKSVIILDGSQLPAVRWFRQGPTLDNLGPGKIPSDQEKK